MLPRENSVSKVDLLITYIKVTLVEWKVVYAKILAVIRSI